ncbi:MAG: hypothetical protein DSZ21_02215 [Tenericutes bacterium]|nr:MAG: hypothetical protein DSZ21_02215 [Mycoplasmatota bacterium]
MPSLRALTIDLAAESPNPSIAVKGGYNDFLSSAIIQSLTFDFSKEIFLIEKPLEIISSIISYVGINAFSLLLSAPAPLTNLLSERYFNLSVMSSLDLINISISVLSLRVVKYVA